MSKKTTLIALISGIVCALSVFIFTQSVQAEADEERASALARYGGEQIEVVVASRDIAPGESITASNVTTKLWLADLMPNDPITKLDEVMGKKASSSIVAGEVLCQQRFDATSVQIDTPSDRCALSVPAEEVQAVGGAVQAGMEVDVYLSGASEVTLLAHDALILATSAGDVEASSRNSFSWITLAVQPSSVQEFIAAAEAGNLYFVLPESDPSASSSSSKASSSAMSSDATPERSSANAGSVTDDSQEGRIS